MKAIDLLKKNGIKLTYVAKKMKMGESLLRYHLSQKKVDSEIEKNLFKVLDEISSSIAKEVEKQAA